MIIFVVCTSCIVTGANAGIGLGMAAFLAAKKARVYMLCRSRERGQVQMDKIVEDTKSDTVHLLQCDCSLEVSLPTLPGRRAEYLIYLPT